MPVRTGYKKSEIAALSQHVTDRGDALIADLPRTPMWDLTLTCNCERCIDPEFLPLLQKTEPPDLTERMIGQYFGGVAAVLSTTDEAAQYEARVVMTHLLAHLGRVVALPREEARALKRQYYYLDPDYLVRYMLDTGFVAQLPPKVAAQIEAYLVDVVHLAVARGATSLDSALCYLALFTDALPKVLEGYRRGAPRRHLRFWSAVAGGSVGSEPSGPRGRGKDFHLFYSGMPLDDVARLLAALEAPEVPRLIERYAFQARDQGWLQYLSNLLEWREATILATRFSDRKERQD